MAVNRWWGPTSDVVTATRLIDRMFDQFFGPGGQPQDQQESGPPTYALPVDVIETEDSFLLYATVAGVPSENVDVTFEDGVLAISVRTAPFERQGRSLRQERPRGHWTRQPEPPKEGPPRRVRAAAGNSGPTPTR